MNDMQEKTGGFTVRIDGYTRFCLSAIVVLLTVLIIGLWAEGPIPGIPDADGAIVKAPRSGSSTLNLLDARSQRAAMLNAARETNRKLDKIVDLLKSGNIRVSIVEAGKEKKAANDVHKPPKK